MNKIQTAWHGFKRAVIWGWQRLDKIPQRVILYLVLFAAILAMANIYAIMLSAGSTQVGIPYGMTKALIGCSTYRATDDFILSRINTYNLMKRNPIGYAIYLSGYAYIIGSSLHMA
jgi:hypothetical protein